MDTVNTLLIRYGINPTAVSEDDKKHLKILRQDATSQNPQEFVAWLENLEKESHLAVKNLVAGAEDYLSLLTKITNEIEAVLGNFPVKSIAFQVPSAKALTEKHVEWLTALDTYRAQCATASASLVERRGEPPIQRETELALRHIALCESEKHPALVSQYETMRQKFPLIREKTERDRGQLLSLYTTLYQTLSEGCRQASASLTAANKTKRPPADYYRNLQTMLLELHTLSQAAKHLQKEASHVQISDGL